MGVASAGRKAEGGGKRGPSGGSVATSALLLAPQRQGHLDCIESPGHEGY